MAHFAQIDENNIVVQVVVIDNEDTLDENGRESESVGVERCKELFGEDTNWVQTSYNDNFRYRYAGLGYSFDAERNAFIPPKPFNSWLFDENECDWVAPKPHPMSGMSDEELNQLADVRYYWDEEDLEWLQD